MGIIWSNQLSITYLKLVNEQSMKVWLCPRSQAKHVPSPAEWRLPGETVQVGLHLCKALAQVLLRLQTWAIYQQLSV